MDYSNEIDIAIENGTLVEEPKLTEDLWAERFKPIPNPYTLGMGYDYGRGSCLMLTVDLDRYLKEHIVDPMAIWTLMDGEDHAYGYIAQGRRYVNAIGWFITESIPAFELHYDIEVE
ncbi:hypothetical protein [Marinobacterium litorale]|uniref:hypothetical protein n=1 Tax=Marinobacterium litorale TaxID=404770 RepID=UPI0004062892|nr:hypothetical protein [Marinobacterium litorale]